MSPEDEPADGQPAPAGPGFLRLQTSVPASSLDAPPAPGGPDGPPPADPWRASPPPWTASQPPWTPSDPPWMASDARWPSSDLPWMASDRPAAGDAAAPPEHAPPRSAGPGGPRRSPGLRSRLSPGLRSRLSPGLRSRLSPGHGMTITAMVTTVALLGTGGIAAWQVGQMQSRLPVTSTSLAMRGAGPARTPGPGRTPARAAASPGAASPATDSRAAGSPATGSPATGSPAAHGAVTVAPAAAVQPHVHRVVMLLDTYFLSINQHDFQAYSSLFIPAIRAGMHSFGPGYLSTRDSRARLTGLSATGPQGLAAMLTFVSHQNPAYSPDHAACNRWHITLFLKRKGNGYHIRHRQPGFPPDTVRPCR